LSDETNGDLDMHAAPLCRTMFGIALATVLCLGAGIALAEDKTPAPAPTAAPATKGEPVSAQPAVAPSPQAKPAPQEAPIPDSRSWSMKQAIDNLRASDKGMRLAALYRLAMEPGPAIQKWIANAAQYDPEPRIRYEAVIILSKRKESPSLPLLMWMAENDKDERVRAAAAQGAGVPLTPKKPPPAPPPAPEAAATPGTDAAQPAPAEPAKAGAPTKSQPAPRREARVDAQGNELPPGYEDMEKDAEDTTALEEKPLVHSGFLPIVGYDGAIGIPRDTLARTSLGAVIGYAMGSFDNVYKPQGLSTTGDAVKINNSFDSKDFSILISGRFAPTDFFELGLEIEAMTYESLSHTQTGSGDYTLDEDSTLKVNNGYSGVALGLASVDAKAIFVDQPAFRFGMALRFTVPSHFGNDKYKSGIGAASLFLDNTPKEIGDETKGGLFFGVEPGFVASYVPLNGLTIYADLTLLTTILTFDRKQQWSDQGFIKSSSNSLSAINLYLVPNVGAQYRILDEQLGFQLALSPVAYMGLAQGAGLASFGIVPGISYRIPEIMELALTFSIEAAPSSPFPLSCTDISSNSSSDPAPCGVGRRFGLALSAVHAF
jgi:hypothetical protein